MYLILWNACTYKEIERYMELAKGTCRLVRGSTGCKYKVMEDRMEPAKEHANRAGVQMLANKRKLNVQEC